VCVRACVSVCVYVCMWVRSLEVWSAGSSAYFVYMHTCELGEWAVCMFVCDFLRGLYVSMYVIWLCACMWIGSWEVWSAGPSASCVCMHTREFCEWVVCMFVNEFLCEFYVCMSVIWVCVCTWVGSWDGLSAGSSASCVHICVVVVCMHARVWVIWVSCVCTYVCELVHK